MLFYIRFVLICYYFSSPTEESLHASDHDRACFAKTLHPSPQAQLHWRMLQIKSEKITLVNSATLIEVKQFNVETTQKILPSIDISIYIGHEGPIGENYQILRRR